MLPVTWSFPAGQAWSLDVKFLGVDVIGQKQASTERYVVCTYGVPTRLVIPISRDPSKPHQMSHVTIRFAPSAGGDMEPTIIKVWLEL